MNDNTIRTRTFPTMYRASDNAGTHREFSNPKAARLAWRQVLRSSGDAEYTPDANGVWIPDDGSAAVMVP